MNLENNTECNVIEYKTCSISPISHIHYNIHILAVGLGRLSDVEGSRLGEEGSGEGVGLTEGESGEGVGLADGAENRQY